MHARIRAGHHRHRRGICHRPARAFAAHVRRQCAVGLRRDARCCDRERDQGARRHPGDRHLAPAFLHHDGGMGARVRLPHPSQRRRPAMDHAAGSRDLSVGRRHFQIVGRRHTDPLRRSFRRRQRAALGGRRERPWRGLFRRHPHRRHRPQVAFLHAQLSEFHSTVGARSRAYRQGHGAVFIRHALRPLFRPRHRRRTPSRCWKIRLSAISRRWRGSGGTNCHFGRAEGANPESRAKSSASCSGFRVRSLRSRPRNDENGITLLLPSCRRAA